MLNQNLSLKTTEMQRQQRIFKNVIIGLFITLLFVFLLASFVLSNSVSKGGLRKLEQPLQPLQNQQSRDKLLSQLQAVRMHNIRRHRDNDDTNQIDQTIQSIQSKQAVFTVAQVNDQSINKEVQAWERRFNQQRSRLNGSSD